MFDRLYRVLMKNEPAIQTDKRTPVQISLGDGLPITNQTVTSEDVTLYAGSSLANRELTRVGLKGDFSTCDISGLKFQDWVDLSGTQFKGQSLGDQQFDRHAYLDKAFVRAENADFSDAQIRILQEPPAEWQNIHLPPNFFSFSGSNFTNASIFFDITGHTLDNTVFSNARFETRVHLIDSESGWGIPNCREM